ncbi:sulfate ABC transporter ATP-binding protein [Pelistega sp. NLN82]|uniref:Sulfate ABC transporter ATP-binding protein n=1 Tax=Pelistega ratti TaxID=2652177 RepID=A0A6L9Y354_9BURK|nr:sulfate ABC transporter ATP-binding protein [Pelistega ratti]NEN74779.1 sulfate ABC transporter ATP-binding protein [Pelistega ratti]
MSIEVKQINKFFGDFHALKNIDLQVKTGSLVSLLGPSGCGKTTLLRIIAGLETADSGQIFLHEQDVTHQKVQDRHIGFMFQNYALFRHMSVFENIAFGLNVLPRKLRPSKDEIREKVHHLLKLIQLPHVAHALPHQLSGGQRQRVALARSLAVEPKILLLDEPFGALDAKVRKELRQWLRDIHQELHITSLLVTHDQEEALEISDQIVVMNHGNIEQIGDASTLQHSPKTAFVTEFIGEVNAFEGEIIADNTWCYKQYRYKLDKAHLLSDTPVGTAVTAYIRPYQWTISQDKQEAMLQGVIKHIHDVGAFLRLTILEPSTYRFIEVQADVSSTFKVDDLVYLTPKFIQFFPKK